MDLVLEKGGGAKGKWSERRFSQKTLLNRKNIKALVETLDSNLFTDFRTSSEIVAKFRVKTIISPSGSLAHQANGCPQKELQNNGPKSFL